MKNGNFFNSHSLIYFKNKPSYKKNNFITIFHFPFSIFHLKNLFTYLLLINTVYLPSYAFEDCIISADGKLTEIKLENNQMIDVYPIFTIMNDKNMLYVHPLKTGETAFSVLKNGKDRYNFSVKTDENKTVIEGDKIFDILTVDVPPELYEFELDEPPTVNQISKEGRNYGE